MVCFSLGFSKVYYLIFVSYLSLLIFQAFFSVKSFLIAFDLAFDFLSQLIIQAFSSGFNLRFNYLFLILFISQIFWIFVLNMMHWMVNKEYRKQKIVSKNIVMKIASDSSSQKSSSLMNSKLVSKSSLNNSAEKKSNPKKDLTCSNIPEGLV